MHEYRIASYISLKKLGYASLIKTYVSFILAKLRFHRLRPEFNGLFEYEEYVTLKGIDDPNEGYVMYILWRYSSDLLKIRDHLRFNGSPGSDRIIPENGLLAFQSLRQQRMPHLVSCATCQGKLGYIQIHHKYDESDVQK